MKQPTQLPGLLRERLVLLPPLLRLLGPNVAKGAVRRGGRSGARRARADGREDGWHRLAMAVVRRPAPKANSSGVPSWSITMLSGVTLQG